MLRSSKACALLLFLLAASPAAGAWPRSAETCDDGLPQVLNVGLPRAGDLPELDLGVLRQAVSRRLTDLYEPPRDRCAGKRRLQVNIAIGCDYQILDWLGQGLIGAAVVPALSLYLLQRDQGDQVKLRELPVAAKAPEDPLSPANTACAPGASPAGRRRRGPIPSRTSRASAGSSGAACSRSGTAADPCRMQTAKSARI